MKRYTYAVPSKVKCVFCSKTTSTNSKSDICPMCNDSNLCSSCGKPVKESIYADMKRQRRVSQWLDPVVYVLYPIMAVLCAYLSVWSNSYVGVLIVALTVDIWLGIGTSKAHASPPARFFESRKSSNESYLRGA